MPREDERPFIAFGNVARGTIAIGNVAYGVVAIGACVSCGVVAIGVNAVGSFVAIGANAVGPIALGLVNGVGILTVAGVNGLGVHSWARVNAGESFVVGVVLTIAFALAARHAPAIIAEPPFVPGDEPQPTPLESLQSGEVEEGWIRADVVASGATELSLETEGGHLAVTAPASLVEEARGLAEDQRARGMLVRVRGSRETKGGNEAAYREAPETSWVLAVVELKPRKVPPRRPAANRIQRASLYLAVAAAFVASVARLALD